jgi:dolichol-phosphate mannosyltransferase
VFVVLGSYSLFCRLVTHAAIPGWTSTVLVASFFGAINALGISMLGEYVVRIYDQVRGRPVYLVDRTVNVSQSDADYEQILRQSTELVELAQDQPRSETAEQPAGK